MMRLLEPAAIAAAWGVPGRKLLTERDPLLLALEHRLVARAVEIRADLLEATAIRIGNAVAKALG